MKPDGSGLRRLTNGPCDSVPSWSRDGRRIAYVHIEGRGCTRPAIWVMGANGSGKRRVAFANMTFDVESLSWSPDGREILYASVQTRRQGSNIVFVRYAVSSVNVATRKVRTVIRADGTGLTRIGPGAKGCQIRVGGGTEPCPAHAPSWASR